DYAHEMLARLLSLRDAFVALFFVTVGVLIDLRVVVDNIGLLGVLVGLVVIGQWAIWTVVSLLFRQSLSTALLVGVGLAQIGEFSFILVQVAREAGHVGADVYSATLRVILAAAQADQAALVILAIPENDRARQAVRRIRSFNPTVQILARVHDLAWRARLMEAGAAEVIQPEEEAASTLIRHALERLSLPRDRVLAYLNRFRGAVERAKAEAEDAETGLPQLREISLRGGHLVDQSLGEVRIRERFGVTVVAVTRATGEQVADPTAETVLRRGDRLRLFGLPRQIATLLSGYEVLIE